MSCAHTYTARRHSVETVYSKTMRPSVMEPSHKPHTSPTLGMMVTLLAWMAAELQSSSIPTYEVANEVGLHSNSWGEGRAHVCGYDLGNVPRYMARSNLLGNPEIPTPMSISTLTM